MSTFFDDRSVNWFLANFDPNQLAGYQHILVYIPRIHTFGFTSFPDQMIPQTLDWTEIAHVHVAETPYFEYKLAVLLNFRHERVGKYFLRRKDEILFKSFLSEGVAV